jgi:hypothetical protein
MHVLTIHYLTDPVLQLDSMSQDQTVPQPDCCS